MSKKENSKNQDRILIVTCGTAGHILPALALVEEGLAIGKNITLLIDKISAATYKNTIESLLFQYNSRLKVFYNKPFKGIKDLISLQFWTDWKEATKIIRSSKQIVTFICGLQIHVLFSSIVFRRKTLFVHEQDSILNKTNRIAHLFIKNINSSFQHVKYTKSNRWMGCPVKKKDSKEITSTNKKIITVLAGTNGSDLFDKNIPLIFGKLKIIYPKLTEYKIYHNCKKSNRELTEMLYKNTDIVYEVSPYFSNFEELIQSSEFLITRGGASTISYLTIYKKNSIIIPWKNSSQGHQLQNAKELFSVNATILVEESQIGDLEKQILNLLQNSISSNMGEHIDKKFKIISGKEYLTTL